MTYELETNQLKILCECIRVFLMLLNKLKLSDPLGRKVTTAQLNKIVNSLSLMKEGDSIIITKPNEQNMKEE